MVERGSRGSHSGQDFLNRGRTMAMSAWKSSRKENKTPDKEKQLVVAKVRLVPSGTGIRRAERGSFFAGDLAASAVKQGFSGVVETATFIRSDCVTSFCNIQFV